MSELTLFSENLKIRGAKLLEESGLIKNLQNFGEVHIVGSFAANLLVNGDIDISVIREESFTQEEALEILKFLYKAGGFRSYFIGGDWNDPRAGNEFPDGYYLGMKTKNGIETWKIDIWFLDTKEFEVRKNSLQIQEVELTTDQRELILRLKRERNEKKLPVSSQTIYEAVLNEGATSLEEISM